MRPVWCRSSHRLVRVRQHLAQQLAGLRQMALVGPAVRIRTRGGSVQPRPGESIQRSLVLELMGRYSNVISR